MIEILQSEKTMFITFEGCEGVGKSTQLKYLKDYLAETNQDAVFLREPGGTEISEQIRNVILDPKNTAMTYETEALLYAAARAQLIAEKILPAQKEGKLIICDRYIYSSIAYQGYARNLGADFVKKVNSFAVEHCMPDYTVFLDLSPEQSWRTVKNDDRMEQETIDFHKKVYEGYLSEISASPERFIVIKPDFDKFVTKQRILSALKEKGIVR